MQSLFSRLSVLLSVLALVLFATACSTPPPPPAPAIDTLRVGFATNYPPVCMLSEDGQPAGLEADFAAALADELDCKLEIVPLDFDNLFPALREDRVDILMAGLTVTPSRAYDMRFCKPYLRNPLVAVTRAGRAQSYRSASQVLASSSYIGVLRHTAAETFVRRHCPRAHVVHVADYATVPVDIEDNRYSIYVDDLAAVLDLASAHSDVLEIIPFPLQQQDIAWAVQPSKESLLSAANAALERWKLNGSLERMLDKWLPGRFR
jgi:polar amino acid transport system substrate-binding protein